MELERETGWQLHPIGGDTGQAYMGVRNEEKLFLKRNSSPFLAALSVEGITPRLIWTKRIGNGDVLTAQEWCNGRTLYKEEMGASRVAQMLGKIHTSETLLRMLKRVGGRNVLPEDFLENLMDGLPYDLMQHDLLRQSVEFLHQSIPFTKETDLSVCHGDLFRKNWLLSDVNRLYVVDWDSAMIADPAYDLAMVLSNYVEEDEWGTWLSSYGVKLTDEMDQKLHWYAIVNDLNYIVQLHGKGRFHRMNEMILRLKKRSEQWFYPSDL